MSRKYGAVRYPEYGRSHALKAQGHLGVRRTHLLDIYGRGFRNSVTEPCIVSSLGTKLYLE